jgi:hypothetical protein
MHACMPACLPRMCRSSATAGPPQAPTLTTSLFLERCSLSRMPPLCLPYCRGVEGGVGVGLVAMPKTGHARENAHAPQLPAAASLNDPWLAGLITHRQAARQLLAVQVGEVDIPVLRGVSSSSEAGSFAVSFQREQACCMSVAWMQSEAMLLLAMHVGLLRIHASASMHAHAPHCTAPSGAPPWHATPP